MYEKVFAYLDAHAEDYAAQLCRWVEVPSVKGEATPDAPFGKDVRRMLDVAMADAKAFGYETRDFDGYACDITLPGESEEAIAVLGHLDVVPAGDNWATPPFTATRVGDQIFARGTSDDKGPALAALYAMNAIKAAGIPLKKSIRLILGCDEESDWEDMAYYCAHTEMPEVGFSPDASFPIINTEKGMIHGFFTSKLAEDGLQVKQLWTGDGGGHPRTQRVSRRPPQRHRHDAGTPARDGRDRRAEDAGERGRHGARRRVAGLRVLGRDFRRADVQHGHPACPGRQGDGVARPALPCGGGFVRADERDSRAPARL